MIRSADQSVSTEHFRQSQNQSTASVSGITSDWLTFPHWLFTASSLMSSWTSVRFKLQVQEPNQKHLLLTSLQNLFRVVHRLIFSFSDVLTLSNMSTCATTDGVRHYWLQVLRLITENYINTSQQFALLSSPLLSVLAWAAVFRPHPRPQSGLISCRLFKLTVN